MVMVSTVNGRITKEGEPHVSSWTSHEDKEYFASLMRENHLMVMGSQSYESAKTHLKLEEGKLRVVLTREPDRYRQDRVPGQLEFTNEPPKQLVERLVRQGFRQMLLLGGGVTNALFLKENLVDELDLTLEPKIFGLGKSLVAGGELVTNLQLRSIKKLNKKGTLLLKYKVLK